jgi:pyruvate formate lyase activating enzyme
METPSGRIFSIERHALHDGDGIRTMVYFKGCPLRCLWCSNPESQAMAPELAFFPARCIGCGACARACAQGANRLGGDGRLRFERARCAGCGACARACCASARKVWGEEMTVEQALAAVRKDLPFYRNSGGGVTLSGGEPLLQAQFAAALVRPEAP